MRKKVLLFVIDALAEIEVRRKLGEAELPHLAELIRDNGQVIRCTSIFPSITPAATCSIVTGQYPCTHGIQGAFWFDYECREFAYFGDDLRLIQKRGFENYLVDFGDRLNTEHLRCKTLFEAFSEHDVTTGCVNFMWYKGPRRHQRSTPWLLRAITNQLGREVYGPDVLKLGDFVEAWPEAMNDEPSLSGGVFKKFGFTDECSMGAVMAMMQQNCLPDFTLAYLPRNDDLAHKVGPREAADRVLTRFDEFLSELAKTAGGWEQLKRDYVLFIVGDHAQSFLLEDADQREIKLDELVDGVSLGNADAALESDCIYFCANMRSAAIYRFGQNNPCFEEITAAVLSDPRIDQVIWQDTTASESKWHVRSASGELVFWRSDSDRSDSIVDNFGNHWLHEGQLAVLDLTVRERHLVEGGYPNALERIASAFMPDEAKPLWVTAKAGYEFSTSDAHVSSRGSHGSLTAEDSNSCLITSEPIAGADGYLRIVDVFDQCMLALAGQEGVRRCD